MSTTEEPDIRALASWYGGNRLLARHVGEELSGCSWVGIPFAGGMSEVAEITARQIMVGDLHRHVVNLGMVAADRGLCPQLIRGLRRLPFHDDVLTQAQEACRRLEETGAFPSMPNLEWAHDYFVCSWMGRSSQCGTVKEFVGNCAKRWTAGGGGSATRYHSAVRSLVAWQRILRRCEFCVLDVFAFLDRCEDHPSHGIYCDPPFPGPGDRYTHRFTEEQHRRLAARLAGFDLCRIVCRFYDHSLIRTLYPEGRWTWRRLAGRKQTNEEAPEVLILNGPSRTAKHPTLRSLFK